VTMVGLVVVSHSATLAVGVVEVAAQMAPDVTIVAAGGTGDGGIGTNFDAVTAAIEQADGGAGVVVLYDLGSARMVAEAAAELADNAIVVDAPLVEGTVVAAVSAQGGSAIEDVAHAAESAAGEAEMIEPESVGIVGAVDVAGGMGVAAAPLADIIEFVEASVTLTDELGLHARPAALVARTMTGFDASVTIRFGEATADGRSVLALMALGTRGGDEVRISATGPQAAEAVQVFQDLAARNFGE
jgi:phosphoenolpyruvate---glycerone phosphotransferase subunit DhaM